MKPQPIPEEYAGNNILNNATRLFEGKLKGPEHLLARGNFIFTGTKTGEVAKIEGNRDISTIATFGKPCCENLRDFSEKKNNFNQLKLLF